MDFNIDDYNTIFSNDYIIEPTNQKPFICDECGLGYRTFSGLYTHKRTHDENYMKKHSCSLCDYSHDNIYHLYRHIRTHKDKQAKIISYDRLTKESKYKKMFDEKTQVFTCPTCNKKYSSRQTIQVHLKSHDINRVFKYECTKCNFKCDHTAQFKRHTISHKYNYPKDVIIRESNRD